MNGRLEPIPREPQKQDEAQAAVGWLAALQRFDPWSVGDLARAFSLLLLLVVFGALLFRFGTQARALIGYPYDWDEDEGLYIHFAQRMAIGEPIYVDFNKLPMTSACYPPVFMAAASLLVPKLGATLLAGRTVSLAALAGISIIVILAVRQETRRWSLGLLGAALILASPYVTTWGPLSRVDSLAMFLVLAGIFLVRQCPRYRILLPAGLALLVLSCYTRYQAVLLVPAAFWHLWRTGRRTAIISFGAFVLAGIAALVWLQHNTGGYFWQSTVTAQATEYLWSFFTERTRGFLQEHAILAAAAIGLIVYQVSRRELDIWGALALTSVFNILLTGKQGAAINYYIPTIVAAAVCTAVAVARVLDAAAPNWSAGAACGAMLILTLQGVLWWLQPIERPSRADREAGDKIMDLIRGTKGDILTERRVTFAMLAGRRPQADLCTLRFAYQIGRSGDPTHPVKTGQVCWDPAELVKALNEKRFAMIVFAGEYFPPEALTAIMINYRMLKDPKNHPEQITMGNWHRTMDRDNKYFIMVPR
jgi:hypothetical protein